MNEPPRLSPPAGAVPCGALVIDRDASSAATARDWLSACLADRDVTEAQVADAALIVSELVTNAWRHGAGQVSVRAAIGADGAIQVLVRDAAPGLPRVAAADDSQVGGWGLQIVEHLASAWGVDPDPVGKTVWAVVPRATVNAR